LKYTFKTHRQIEKVYRGLKKTIEQTWTKLH